MTLVWFCLKSLSNDSHYSCFYYCRFSVFTDAALDVIDSLSNEDNNTFRKFLRTLLPSDLEWIHLRADTLSKVNEIYVSFSCVIGGQFLQYVL